VTARDDEVPEIRNGKQNARGKSCRENWLWPRNGRGRRGFGENGNHLGSRGFDEITRQKADEGGEEIRWNKTHEEGRKKVSPQKVPDEEGYPKEVGEEAGKEVDEEKCPTALIKCGPHQSDVSVPRHF
jgi:hypothetical protein